MVGLFGEVMGGIAVTGNYQLTQEASGVAKQGE